MSVATRCASLVLGALAVTAANASGSDAALFGFGAEETAAQRSLEANFDSNIKAADLDAWLKTLSSEANQVGAPHDKANAEFVRDRFKEWGWDAQIETFDVLYPTLKQHKLELLGPTQFTASLKEPPIEGDSTSSRSDGMDAYNAYGGDGDVTGELVYVNYGMPDDYKDLARRGIDVKGKIVIARYGAGWRGLKPKLAQEHGALGCIIYSDPHEDGYSHSDTYPKGSSRPAAGLQRGSVADMPVYPGDPLTPGVGATKNAKRLPISQAKSILKIPVIPVSYADAQPLLAALTGPVAPERWRGSLPMTYHIGPGAARVHLMVQSDWSQKTLYDVIAKIPGAELPDEWVVRGNHRDAWVYGAWDPLSGHVAMMAEAKAIGALVKAGFKPKRTIVYASWDGEEPGLLGSTEWAETHADELKHKAVLYLNSDTNSRGFLDAGGSHALQKFVDDVATSVVDPEANVSTEARLRAKLMADGLERGASEAQKKDAKIASSGADLRISPLGSGSDYSPFLQHLGVTTLDISYSGEEEPGGVYHSKYDSYDYYVRFVDPGLTYGVVEAKTVGRIILRMADADVLPLRFSGFVDAVDGYLGELHELAGAKRKNAEELAKAIDQKAFAVAEDPKHRLAPPEYRGEVPYLDFAPMDNVLARLKKSAKAYDDLYAKVPAGALKLDANRRKQLNSLLQGMEQTLTDQSGLPTRDWYKHFIYAPGLLTGYGVKTLPAIREAIDDDRWDEANRYIEVTAKVVGAYCDRLDRATQVLKGG